MGQVFVWSSHHRSARTVSSMLEASLTRKPTPHGLGDGIGVDLVVGMGDSDERRGENGGLERRHRDYGEAVLGMEGG